MDVAEHPVGVSPSTYSGDDTVVIVENQLEQSDHGHLGQILTYAAGTDAKTIASVATGFRPEHRPALDWLNEPEYAANNELAQAITLLCNACGHVLTVGVEAVHEQQVRHTREQVVMRVQPSTDVLHEQIAQYRSRGCAATYFTQVSEGSE